MRRKLCLLTTAIGVVAGCPFAEGQWNNNVGGDIFCDPLLPPQSVTIGDGTIVNEATLNVRGDQLPVVDPFFGGLTLCTFKTDVAAVKEQSWWMYRDANHIGRIWHNSGHRAFHFQSMEPVDIGLDRYSGAMIQNHQYDGLWVVERRGALGFRHAVHLSEFINRKSGNHGSQG